VALVGSSVVALGAPASAATESPKVWAKGVCATVGDWTADVDARLSDASVDAPEDADAARTALTRTLGQLAKRTKKLVKAIEDGGAPDVEGGNAIVRGLAEGFGDVVDGLRDARARIVDAPDDPEEVAATIRDTAVDLQNLLVQANLDIADLDLASRPLQRAFEKAPACQELVAG
jgi:hypothetical protein